ncbi:MAG: hypothetical protein JO217_07485 [Acidobacteriaceae bacterium]|nr:hypothetical protein [Acidobacteriaceae bacterium]MBV9442522.1 hypothetical protein [Acidobacteriaceae bacterium]
MGHVIVAVLFGVAEIGLQQGTARHGHRRREEEGRLHRTTERTPARAGAGWRTQGLTAPEIANVLGVKERTVFSI